MLVAVFLFLPAAADLDTVDRVVLLKKVFFLEDKTGCASALLLLVGLLSKKSSIRQLPLALASIDHKPIQTLYSLWHEDSG